MNDLTALLAFGVCLALSALYSGSETAFYSLSRARLEADAAEGRRSARLVRYLIRDESLLLVTLLVGNNLVLELMTAFGDNLLGSAVSLPSASREVVLTALLTPLVFLLGELVPKDVFRHRPHTLLGFCAPVIAFTRGLLLPLALPLRALAALLERAAGLRP
ncbi:MAG TPA: DUF21 domain-containing protein, partial [Planctomycetota bacterium]|nr:DUF21 domain-containing protein [Planctomycetota bacterium]